MKNLQMILLTALSLVFTPAVFAVVDCEGLSQVRKAAYIAKNFSELGKEVASKSSEYSMP